MQRQLAIEMALTPAKTPIPYIRLRGCWLGKLGFAPGARVRVLSISPGLVALKAIDPQIRAEPVVGPVPTTDAESGESISDLEPRE